MNAFFIFTHSIRIQCSKAMDEVNGQAKQYYGICLMEQGNGDVYKG